MHVISLSVIYEQRIKSTADVIGIIVAVMTTKGKCEFLNILTNLEGTVWLFLKVKRCFVSQVRLELACIQHQSFLSMWPSCYIFYIYGVNLRNTVRLPVLAAGLNHLNTVAGGI